MTRGGQVSSNTQKDAVRLLATSISIDDSRLLTSSGAGFHGPRYLHPLGRRDTYSARFTVSTCAITPDSGDTALRQRAVSHLVIVSTVSGINDRRSRCSAAWRRCHRPRCYGWFHFLRDSTMPPLGSSAVELALYRTCRLSRSNTHRFARFRGTLLLEVTARGRLHRVMSSVTFGLHVNQFVPH